MNCYLIDKRSLQSGSLQWASILLVTIWLYFGYWLFIWLIFQYKSRVADLLSHFAVNSLLSVLEFLLFQIFEVQAAL